MFGRWGGEMFEGRWWWARMNARGRCGIVKF